MMRRLSVFVSFCVFSTFGASAAAIDVDVGFVSPLAQPTDMVCWATAATMLQSWKDQAGYDISTVMLKAGQTYVDKFNSNFGLSGSEKPQFLKAMGLVAEAPQNFSVQGWAGLMKAYGPLWVTTNEGAGQNFAIHARVLTGIHGDGTPSGTTFKVIDPAGGTAYDETITVFVKKFEDIANNDLGQGADIRPQVVHFPTGAQALKSKKK